MDINIETHCFEVGLSFAGEGREFIKRVADKLTKKLGEGKVFYDKYYEAQLAVINLSSLLQNIYNKRCSLIVIFIDSHYKDNLWCKQEWRSVVDVINTNKKSQSKIMLIVFDKYDISNLDGLYSSTDGSIDANNKSESEIVNLIITRVNGNKKTQNSENKVVSSPVISVNNVGTDSTKKTESKKTQQLFIFTILIVVIIVILFVIILKVLYYPASEKQFTDFPFTTKNKTEIIHISNPIYKNLEKLLKNRKFEEADQETFNLMRSIAKLKNNEINFDGKKDILTFDCEALRTIDMLWAVNSNNNFGFSIQSQIWIEEGGKLGNYDDAETSDRFAERIGWDVKKKSFFNPIAQYDCQFHEEKKGNLPCQVNVHIFKQGVPYIVERLKYCKY